MIFSKLRLGVVTFVATVLIAPAHAASTITFGKVTTASGGYFDTRTGGTPAAVRQAAQKGWDNPLTPDIDETIAELWCIEPNIIALFNTPISFSVKSLADYVASGAISAAEGNLFAGYARAGTLGTISNAHASGLLYRAAGGAINFGHAPTADFFAAATAAAATIPAWYFNMKGITVYDPGLDVNGKLLSQIYLSAGAIPEPASWAMLIAGFGLVGATARRRRTGIIVAA